jgi:hypothetical protein
MTVGELRELLNGRDETDVVCVYDIPADSPAISHGGFGAVVPVDDTVEHKTRDDGEGGRMRCLCFTINNWSQK